MRHVFDAGQRRFEDEVINYERKEQAKQKEKNS
jgi:hypothetical protein